jgi:hypothetical protein
MTKRSIKVQQVKAILQQAPDVQTMDRSYQAEILQRWYTTVQQQQSPNNLVLENEKEETIVV